MPASIAAASTPITSGIDADALFPTAARGRPDSTCIFSP